MLNGTLTYTVGGMSCEHCKVAVTGEGLDSSPDHNQGAGGVSDVALGSDGLGGGPAGLCGEGNFAGGRRLPASIPKPVSKWLSNTPVVPHKCRSNAGQAMDLVAGCLR